MPVIGLAALVALLTAQTPPADLVVNPWQDPGLVAAVAQRPGLARAFQRILLVTYASGQSLVSTQQPWMRQPSFGDGKEVIRRLAARCAVEQVPLVAVAEFLRWNYRDCEYGTEIAEVLEVNRLRRAVLPPRYLVYLSPFQPLVRAAVRDIAASMASRAEFTGGVAFSLRLAPEDVFGFSRTARAVTIRSLGWDPADGVPDNEWANWTTLRENSLTALLAETTGDLRARKPGLRTMALATGDLLLRTPGERCASADNWADWLERGLVDEVLLDSVWTTESARRIWGSLRQASMSMLRHQGKSYLGDAARPTSRLRPLVHSDPDTDSPSTLMDQWAALRAEPTATAGPVLYPRSVQELEAILAQLPKTKR